MTDGSENKKTSSDTGKSAQENVSVYDFLYHDTRRVGSFYAQLTGFGDWTQHTRSNTVAKGNKRGWKLAAGGGVPDVATGEASLELGPSEEGSFTSERVFDPLWHKAKLLLDHLAEEDLLEKEIRKARYGQFVLVKGTLLVFDLAMLKHAWDKPSIKQLMQAREQEREKQQTDNQNRQQRRQQRASQINLPSQSKITSELMSFLPHSVQAHFLGDGAHV